MSKQNLDVIIVGGGIGGLCLAQGLKKAGIKVTVFEKNKDNDSWLEGYRIHVNPVGSHALNQCLPSTLWEAFLAGTGDAKDGFGFMTEQMKELVFIDEEMMVGYTNDPAKRQYAASRKMLRHVLQAGLTEEIIYSKAFQRYSQTDDGKVNVFFEDGTMATGNVLVGADGSNSKIRAQLIPHARRITTNGVAIAGKTMLNDDARKWLPHAIFSRMNVIMPLNKYFFFNASFDHKIKNEKFAQQITQAAVNAGINPETFFDSKENYILWAFIAHKNEFPSDFENKNADLRKAVLDKVDNWHPDLKRLIKEADEDSLIFLPFKVMEPIKNWKTINVTILGDAVHNMPPLYGMGANMAMHDAAMLCKKLVGVENDITTLSTALEAFQDKMLKDGFGALDNSMKYTKQAISYNVFQRFISRSWFKLCNHFPSIKKYTFGARWTEQ